MEKEILKVPAGIEKVMTMADGGLRLFVDTQELNPVDKGKVMAMHKQMGFFVFAPQDIEIEENDLKGLPKITMDKDEKSPGQILRGRMYVYYVEKYQTKEGFFQWYANQLEIVGQQYLNKLQ